MIDDAPPKPVLLDLFCGAGGASAGYARAGFGEIVGVDIEPQPDYPFRFYRYDWEEGLEMVMGRLMDDDELNVVVHASPPCQGYSPHVYSADSRFVPTRGTAEPRLIAEVRSRIATYGVPYVIENVYGARDELVWPTLLCGVDFGLPIHRHRLFEVNGRPGASSACQWRVSSRDFAAARGWEHRDMSVTGKGRRSGTSERWAEIMGIDWPMSQHQMAEAIPPVYTEWIGKQLLEEVSG